MNARNEAVDLGGEHNAIDSALDAGRRLALEVRKSPIDEGKPYVILRDADGSERVEFIDARFQQPARSKGTIPVNDVPTFLALWDRYSNMDSLIYGTLHPAQFIAVINDNCSDSDEREPGWRDWRIAYLLQHSKEWKEWTGRNRQPFGGTDKFAMWLEDQLPDIVKPGGAELLQIALTFRVGENIQFRQAIRLDNGQIDLDYTRIVEGSATGQAGRKVQIPEQFTIEVPVFDGLDAPKYRVEARFRYRLNNGALSLWYELIRPDDVLAAAFRAVYDAIAKGAKQGILYGKPE